MSIIIQENKELRNILVEQQKQISEQFQKLAIIILQIILLIIQITLT